MRPAVISIIFCFAFITLVSSQETITFSTNQTEYFFPVGQEAAFEIMSGNPYGTDIQGQFSYSISQEQSGQGMVMHSSNSESKVLTIESRAMPLVFMLGAQPQQSTFTFSDARFEYKDPDGKEIVVTLGPVTIHIVDPSQMQQQGQQKGQESQSTTKEQEREEQRQEREKADAAREEQLKEEMRQKQEANKLQNRIQNNQQNQDAGALRQQIQQELAEQKAGEEAMKQALMDSTEFQEMAQELLEEGYNLTGQALEPQGNNSGDFNFEFQDGQGNKADIKGSVEQGKVSDIAMDKQRSLESLMEEIERDERFREYNKGLGTEGYARDEPKLLAGEKDETTVIVPYKDADNKTAEIEVLITGETIREVKLKKERSWWWVTLIPLALALMLLAARKKKATAEVVGPPERDQKGEAEQLIAQAEKEFARGRMKEGALLVSEAVRLILSWKHGITHAMTDSQARKELERKGKGIEARRCLELCGMVEFARCKAQEDDIRELLISARKAIGSAGKNVHNEEKKKREG